MKMYTSVEELVGSTPLMSLTRFCRNHGIYANISAKLEFLNPTGSAKDRVALQMIKDAENLKLIKPGYTIIEPTSGNTGIGLAAIGTASGYNVIITMPDTMSAERIKTMEAYGAKVVLTDGKLGMAGAIAKAEELESTLKNAYVMGQFTNQSNPNAHYTSTGPEIWSDTDGNVDILVSAVGTGGTITGIGKYLKEKNKNIKIIAVEPKSSPVLSGGNKGTHKIQGIGAGFVPEVLDTAIYDEIITVSDEDAYKYGKMLVSEEGLMVGISSGAALSAAVTLAQRDENRNKNIVIVLPDSGLRYLSTPEYF